MPLTKAIIDRAKVPAGKTLTKLSDGHGLYLLVTTKSKSWKYDYRHAGKRRTLSLGVYPLISLDQAREIHYKARKDLAAGIDPSALKQADKIAEKKNGMNTFGKIAATMLAKQKNGSMKTASYDYKTKSIATYLLPHFGKKPISDITAAMIFDILNDIESSGKIKTAHKVKGQCGEIMRYAIRVGIMSSDPTAALAGALGNTETKHRPHLSTHADIAKLMQGIHDYQGNASVVLALQLSPLLMLRPKEICQMQWQWVDFEQQEIRFPETFMKMKNKHIVPLSKQSVEILEKAATTTKGSSIYVFRSRTMPNKPMSAGEINKALRKMGWNTQTQICAHGMRGTAATMLDEHMGYNSDAIERQLSHQESNQVKAAYRHSQHIKTRTIMMQAWADYLYNLRDNGNVIDIKTAKVA